MARKDNYQKGLVGIGVPEELASQAAEVLDKEYKFWGKHRTMYERTDQEQQLMELCLKTIPLNNEE